MQEPAYPGTVFESATEFLKTPPFSIEAEQSVLGGLMLNNAAWISIADRLVATDFYRPEHKTIFNAIKSLCEDGHPCDVVTLSEWLERQTQLESIGGLAYLGLLARNTPSAANIVAYADIVREHSILRQLIKVGTAIANSGFNSQGRNSAELLDHAERQVFEIAEQQARNRGGFVQLKDILTQTLDQIDVLSRKEGLITGVATGFNDFDKMTSGLQRSDLIIVAGRPSHGKCLAQDAQIMLVDGRIFSIKALYQRQQAQLLTLNQHGCFQATQASAFIDDGMKPVFRVTTALGRTLKTTATHPYLTPQGWRPLATLKVGTQIAVPRQLECFGAQPLPLWEIKLLSYLVGQEDLSIEPLQLTLTHPRLQEDIHDICSSIVEPHRHSALPQAINTAAVATSAITYTLKTVPQSWRALLTQAPPSIPEVILTLPRPQLALFLNRLFAIKGYCHKRQLCYDGISEPLARQLQHLLVRFGIIATLQHSRQHYWQVMINQPSACQRFIAEIGLFVHTVDLATAPQKTDAEAIYWDEIIAIEACGSQPVYDLTIPTTHNFVANDICVHNTSFAMNIAEHVAVHEQTPVAVFSMEMSDEQLMMRLIASASKVNLQNVRTGKLSDDDWANITKSISKLESAPLFIDDTPALNPTELRARVRRLAREHGPLGLIVVDYLQLMQISDAKENRATEVSEISRSLKALAKELDVPLIALSQLNRSLEQRPDKRPRMADLRESGSIEQDSDLIIFIYRDEVYNPDSADKGTAEIIIGKQRNGPTGTARLTFRGHITKFENFTTDVYYGEGLP